MFQSRSIHIIISIIVLLLLVAPKSIFACNPPQLTASITDADNIAGDSIAVCVGELVEFSGYAIPEQGSTIDSLIWNFSDGYIYSTNSNVVTHTFDQPGYYYVKFSAFDSDTCFSITFLNVFVSTYPSFNPLTDDTTVCLVNGEFNLYAYPEVYSTSYTLQASSVCYDNNCLEDNLGVFKYMDLEITNFEEDLSIESIDDILNVSIDIEHSFPGDFNLDLICPNGSVMALSNNQGGGSNLGDPGAANIVCDLPSTFGEAWTYRFTTSDTTTWDDFGPPNYSIPAGDYAPYGSFENLIACPINGTWTLRYVDLHGGDDGSLPCWAVNFREDLYPEEITFISAIGTGIDSSFWDSDGIDIIDSSSDGNIITINPQNVGEFEYVYTVINDFGCSFDTTTIVNVVDYQIEAFIVDGDSVLCDETATISASLFASQDGLFVYSWSPSIGLSNPNQKTTNVVLDSDTVTYTISVYPLGKPGCVATSEITLMGDPSLNAGNSTELILCWNSEVIDLAESLLGGNPDLNGVWTNSAGQLASEIDPNNSPDSLFIYTVTDSITSCFKTSQLIVVVNEYGHPDCCTFSMDYSVSAISCNDYEDGFIIYELSGNVSESPFDLTFEDPLGEVTNLQLEAGIPDTLWDLSAGAFYYEMSSSQSSECLIFDTIFIEEPLPLTTLSLSDTYICIDGEANLQVSALGGNGIYTHYWTTMQGNSFESGPFESIIIDSLTVDPTNYTVYTMDQNDCISEEFEISVDILPAITINIPLDSFFCANSLFILNSENIYGGNYIGGNIYEAFLISWYDDEGNLISGPSESDDFAPQEDAWYFIEVEDNCTTPMESDSIYLVIKDYPALNFSSDTSNGCTPLEIQFLNLTDENDIGSVEWSFGLGGYSTDIDPSFTYVNGGVFDVNLSVISPFGCQKDTTFSDYITAKSSPLANFSYSPESPTISDPVVSFLNISFGQNINYWEFYYGDPDFGTSDQENPTFTFPDAEPGIYPVFLLVSAMNHCSDSVIIDVEIGDYISIELPGSFSPNGDGKNDLFGISGNNISRNDFFMRIYDSVGKLVFESVDLDNQWDGRNYSNNSVLPIGIYIYQVQYRTVNSSGIDFINGKVLLLK